MSIVNRLTLRHLKANKGRTVVTTLGICVSVAMITAVFVALASFLNLFGEMEMITGGNYQANISSVTQEQLTDLRQDERIAKIGLHKDAETSFLMSDRKNDRLGTGEICIGDEVYISQILTVQYEGTIPKNENEIAIEQKLLDRNNLNLKIGDKIRLSEGYRYISASNGEEIVYKNYHKGEKFLSDTEREYTITAILHDNPPTRFTPIIRGMSEKEKSGNINITIQLAKINHKSLAVLKEIINKYKFDAYRIETDYLSMYFAIDENNEMMITILSMSAIILAVIMVASVVLIYNAFAMSISERVRYLGMLASVGATKRQKRLSVYFEGFILGIIGVPLGVAGGITGIGITLKSIGKRIISTGMIMGVSDNDMQMRIVVPIWAIIGIVIVSAVTIFISSFVPSQKASKITPIDAIRQTNEVKVKARRLRSSRLIRFVFGYEGELANKNLKRNGKKARIITASITLSVVLFLCCNYFCSAFTSSVDVESNIPYQVQVSVDYNDKERICERLDNMNYVDDYYCVSNRYFTIDGKQNEKHQIAMPENLKSSYKRLFDDKAILALNTLDDEDFNELCRANGIDYKSYYGNEYKVLLLNNVSKKSSSSAVFTDRVIGCNVSELFDSDSDKMTVGDLIDFDAKQKPCLLNPQKMISLYEPVSQHIRFNQKSISINASDENGEKTGYYYLIGVETTEHSRLTEEIEEYLSTEGYDGHSVYDIAESAQTMNTLSFVIQVLIYGFIAMISLITVFNIINTISTGVMLRKKEFAMLKSVGTTPRGFNKMIMLESAFYGIKALVVAIPVSIALSFAMYKAMHPSGMIAFDLNLPLYICVIAVVILIIGATMLYSVHKLRSDSIVSTLKEEIN